MCYSINRDYVSFTDELTLRNEAFIMTGNDLVPLGEVLVIYKSNFLWSIQQEYRKSYFEDFEIENKVINYVIFLNS